MPGVSALFFSIFDSYGDFSSKQLRLFRSYSAEGELAMHKRSVFFTQLKFLQYLLCLLLLIPLQILAGPAKYYVLTPESVASPLSVMSLESGNVITAGANQLNLDKYQTGSIPASSLGLGAVVSGTAAFSVGSAQSAVNLLTPSTFAGTSFVVPHISGSHKYFVLSPAGSANVIVRLGANTLNATTAEGVVTQIDAGLDNTISGIITSDVPIVLAHVAYAGTTPQYAFSVPPAAPDVYGIRSQNVSIGASQDGTTAIVYGSDGSSTTYALNAGGKVDVGVGANAVQGGGSAIHISANAPITAVQYEDGDGASASAFWPPSIFSTYHGLPVNAQYANTVCNQTNVSVTLYKGSLSPETQTCSGSATNPGKVYFGANTSGANLTTGWYFVSSSPVYLMYESASAESEYNLLGFTPPAGPSAPNLQSVSSPTSSNPVTITGTALANQSIRIYVNGLLQTTTVADGSGVFSANAPLVDGNNSIYSTAVNGANESSPSNIISVAYTNSISRTQSGTISGTVVWTPGSPAQPYVVTGSDLTIAAGGKLIIQPGTEVQFAANRKLIVNGALIIQGTSTAKAKLTSNKATKAKGDWEGVVVYMGATTTINNAIIEYAKNGVAFLGPSVGDGTLLGGSLTNSELRNNTTGIFLVGYMNSTIQNNSIHDNTNGLWTDANSTTFTMTPTITNNKIYSNSSYGVAVRATVVNQLLPSWTFNSNSIYSNTTHNFYFTASAAFLNPATTKLNLKNNWWGSADPVTIAAKIYDYSDSNVLPTLDFGNYLSAEGGAPVAGEMLSGTLSANTTVTSGTTARVLGTLNIPSGVTLTIESGATLTSQGLITAASGATIDAQAGSTLSFVGTIASITLQSGATLNIVGTSSNKVLLTSSKATKAKADWWGIIVNTGATATISHAIVEYAADGVAFKGGSTGTPIQLGGLLENTELRYSNTGVYLVGYVNPTIRNNLLHDNSHGIYLDANSTTLAAAPTITNNTIYNNSSYGVAVRAWVANQLLPNWTFSNNGIYNNTTYNFYFATNAVFLNPATTKLNAKNNWWGSNSPSTIAAKIYDYSDVTTLPTLDFGNYLDAESGVPVEGQMISGTLSANTTVTAGPTARILGSLIVPAGITLTVEPGAILRSYGLITVASGATLNIQPSSTIAFFGTATGITLQSGGTLNILGTSADKILLTSNNATKAKGNWAGIVVNTGANATISNAIIEYATQGITFTGPTSGSVSPLGGLLENSELRNNTTGVYLLGYVNPTIGNNSLHDNTNGIYVDANSATLAATPTITNNQIIDNSSYGIVVRALVANQLLPNWTLSNNSIHSNASYNFYFTGSVAFRSPSTAKLNAKNNWWGSSSPWAIALKNYDYSDSTSLPTLDFGNYLNAEGGAPVEGQMISGTLSSNTTVAAGTTTHVMGSLIVPSGVTLTVEPGATLSSQGLVTVASGATLNVQPGSSLKFFWAAAEIVLQSGGTLNLQGTSTNQVLLTSYSATKAKGDWGGITINSGATATITNSIIEYASDGVTFNGPTTGSVSPLGGSLTNSELRNNTAAVRLLGYVNPTIQDSSIHDNSSGIWLEANSTTLAATPSITSNAIYNNSSYGVVVRAYIANQLLPNWTLINNSIYNNTTYNFYFSTSAAFLNPATTKLNAKNNWWGSNAPSTIAAKIYDYSDATTLPTVDYGNYLSSEGGAAVEGQMISGTLNANTIVTAGTTTRVLGTLNIPSGMTLTVESGATLASQGLIAAAPGAAIDVQAGSTLTFVGTTSGIALQSGATLNIAGTSSNKVLLTSGKATKAKSDWVGIIVNAGATASVVNAVIEYAWDGVAFKGAATGSASPLGGLVENSEFRNGNTGVYLVGYVNPTIRNNSLHDNTNGFYVDANSTTLAMTPMITNNKIYNNSSYGVVVRSTVVNQLLPNWTFNNNSIYNNTTHNFYFTATSAFLNPATTKLNAKNNWWGSNSPSTIASKIYDYSDATTLPTLDFGNYLDSEGGEPVEGFMLSGRLSDQAGTTFQSGKVYFILGDVTVPAGETLTIPAGVTLRFVLSAAINVQGSLSINGEPGNEVLLTSSRQSPTATDWEGVWVKSGAGTVNINHVVIQYANYGLRFDASGTVGTVNNALIQLCNHGVYVNGTAHPTIANSRLVTNNYGVYVYGTNNEATNPKPVLKDNDIFNNVTKGVNVTNYTTNPTTKIDVTNVWWGSTTPTFTGNATNTSPIALAPMQAPIAKTQSVTNAFFSPNADEVQDAATLSATLSEATDISWTVDVQDLTNGALVRSFSGSDATVAVSWDGKNASGVAQPDGAYAFVMRVSTGARTGYALQRQVLIDQTPPIALLDSGLSAINLSNLLSKVVNGSANDMWLASYSLEYATAPAPISWMSIASNVTIPVSNGPLATWTIGTTTAGATVPNGDYYVRLTVKDSAGNETSTTTTVTIDNISLTSVSNAGKVDLGSGQSAAINFNLNMPGTTTIKIYDISTGTAGLPVATISQNFTTAGAKTVNWDGRDTSGNFVAGKAYIYVIEASDGTRQGLYDLTGQPLTPITGNFSSNRTCSAAKNEFYKLTVTATQPGLAGAQISFSNQKVYPFGVNGTPIPVGTTTVYWDCRDPNTGAMLTFASATEYFAFTQYPANTIIVTGNELAPKISGISPTIEVKSDPYLVYLSYGHFTKIAYAMSLFNAATADVQIKLLPPGVLNFDDSSAILVYEGVRSVGNHEVTWTGTLAGNEDSSYRAMGSAEGAYTFAIKATVNGMSTLYRGTLNTYQ